jgi:membrane-associated phospholipid phosphatase
LLLTGVAVAFSFRHIDVPLAVYMLRFSGPIAKIGNHLGSAVLLTGETAVALTLVIYRLVHGSLTVPARALAVACFSSIAAYAINASVLKMMFGVPVPGEVVFGHIPHVAHLFAGTYDSSFPSGHMTLAGAFGGVVMRRFPKTVWPLGGLLAVGAMLLVAGNWHFLSDVLAGTFVGVSAGVLAGEFLIAHERERA